MQNRRIQISAEDTLEPKASFHCVLKHLKSESCSEEQVCMGLDFFLSEIRHRGGFMINETEHFEEFVWNLFENKVLTPQHKELTFGRFVHLLRTQHLKFGRISEKLNHASGVSRIMLAFLKVVGRMLSVSKLAIYMTLDSIYALARDNPKSPKIFNKKLVRELCHVLSRTNVHSQRDIMFSLLGLMYHCSEMPVCAETIVKSGVGYEVLIDVLRNFDYTDSIVNLCVGVMWNLIDYVTNVNLTEVISLLFSISQEIQKEILSNQLKRKVVTHLCADIYSIFLLLVSAPGQRGKTSLAILAKFNLPKVLTKCVKSYNQPASLLIPALNLVYHFSLDMEVRELFNQKKNKIVKYLFRYADLDYRDQEFMTMFNSEEVVEIWVSVLSVMYLYLRDNKEMIVKYSRKLLLFHMNLSESLRNSKVEEKVITLLCECARIKEGAEIISNENLSFATFIDKAFSSVSSSFVQTSSLQILAEMCHFVAENARRFFKINGVVKLIQLLRNNVQKPEFCFFVIECLEYAMLNDMRNLGAFLRENGLEVAYTIMKSYSGDDDNLVYYVLGFLLAIIDRDSKPMKWKETDLVKMVKSKERLITFLLTLFQEHSQVKNKNDRSNQFIERIFLIFNNLGFHGMDYLTTREREIITRIKPFEKYHELEIWKSIKNELKEENITPVKEDWEMLDKRLNVLGDLKKEIEEENRNIREQIEKEESNTEKEFWDFVKFQMKKNDTDKDVQSMAKSHRLPKEMRKKITHKYLYYTYFSKIK